MNMGGMGGIGGDSMQSQAVMPMGDWDKEFLRLERARIR
jgi:hypothetical protein